MREMAEGKESRRRGTGNTRKTLAGLLPEMRRDLRMPRNGEAMPPLNTTKLTFHARNGTLPHITGEFIMTDITFAFLEALQAAGVPQDKAKTAIETLNQAIDSRYAIHARELATRGDVEKVRADVEKVRVDMEKMRAELATKIEASRHDILRWYVTGLIGQTIAIGYFILKISGH
jgi:hypothetical protein